MADPIIYSSDFSAPTNYHIYSSAGEEFKETWSWDSTPQYIGTTVIPSAVQDNMEKKKPIGASKRKKAESSENLLSFKELMELNMEDEHYPSESLVNDINYWLSNVSNGPFDLRIKRSFIDKDSRIEQYPITGTWGRLELFHILYIKNKIIPRATTIRLAFRELLSHKPEEFKKGYIQTGDYIWYITNMVSTHYRVLFKKIIKTTHPNKVVWAEFFQNKLIEAEFALYWSRRATKKKKVATGFLEEYIDAELPRRVSNLAQDWKFTAGIMDSSTPRVPSSENEYLIDYPVKVTDGVSPVVPAGNYRWSKGKRGEQLEDLYGNMYQHTSSGWVLSTPDTNPVAHINNVANTIFSQPTIEERLKTAYDPESGTIETRKMSFSARVKGYGSVGAKGLPKPGTSEEYMRILSTKYPTFLQESTDNESTEPS